MRRSRLAVLALAIGPVLALATAAPGLAGTRRPVPLPAMPTSHSRSVSTVPDRSPSAMAGFAAVSSGGTVDHFTSYNSAGGAVAVSHPSTGLYNVFFDNLAFPGGDVQVSDLDGVGTCAVNSWGESGPNLVATVNCYNATGAASDEAFDVLVTQPHGRPAGVLDYDWVYHNNGNLVGGYQYNSAHRTNSVKNPSTGLYIVTMPGVPVSGASKGTVKVSAYGPGAGSCQVVTSRTTRIGEQIEVACFTASGVRQDRDFTVAYARGNNLMGQNGKLDANATAAGARALYQPAVQFDSKAGARVSVAHLDRGVYELLFVGTTPTHHFSGGFGDLQITTVGSAFRKCGIALIPTHTPFALLACVNASGSPVNTSFIVQLVFN